MSKLARHPPSRKKVILILAVIGICLSLVALERLGLLPDWMQLDPRAGRGLRLPRG